MLKDNIDEFKLTVIVNIAEKIVNEIGMALRYELFTHSPHINELILKLTKDTSCPLEAHKVLSEWADIIHNNLHQIEEELTQVMSVLFK